MLRPLPFASLSLVLCFVCGCTDTTTAESDTSTTGGPTTETSATSSSTGEETSSTETGTEGSCELLDDESPATQRTLILTNVDNKPLYIVPEDDCTESYFHELSIDGVDARDDALETCSDLAKNWCEECDKPDSPLPALRIEPGGSYSLHFDGYVFQNETVDPALDCSSDCWEGEACLVGRPVAEDATMTVTLHLADTCFVSIDPVDCECGLMESCEVYSVSFPDETPFEVEFVHGAEPTVIELSD